MFIFIHGEESYLSQSKLLEITTQYKKVNQNNFNLSHLDFAEDENGLKNFIQITSQNSIFPQKKMVVIKNCFSNSEARGGVLSHLQKLKSKRDLLILFYETNDVDKESSLFKFLQKEAKTQEIKKLNDRKLRLWVDQEIKKYNLKMSFQTEQLLIQFCGNDLWRLANEIKKIALYKYPEKEIDENDIKKIVEPIIITDIFKTIDAIAIKNKKETLSLIHNHFQKGDNPLYLLSMILYQFRNLIMVKFLQEKARKQGYSLTILEIIDKTNLHPFVAKKTALQAKKFSIEELQKIYQKLLDLDINIKRGKIEPLAGIISFLLEN